MSTTLSTSQKRTIGRPIDLSRLLARIENPPDGMSFKRWDREKRIITCLGDGPRTTSEISAKFPGNYADLTELLHALVVADLLAVDDKRYGGRGKDGRACREDNLYSVNVAGIRSAAKAQQRHKSAEPLESAPDALKDLFHRVDLRKPALRKAGIRTEHRLWRVAQFCCAVYPRRVASMEVIAAEMGLKSRDGVKLIRDSAVDAGWIKQHNSELVGHVGRPSNDYEVKVSRIKKSATLPEARARLGPERATDMLGELVPKKDLRTRDQRRWCDAIDSHWEDTGCEAIEDWEAYKNILAVVGPGRTCTYKTLAKDLGARSNTPVEKYMRRAKQKPTPDLIEVAFPTKGHRQKARRFIPNNERLAAIAGLEQEPATNGKPKKRAAAEPAETPAAALEPPAPVKPSWDADGRELRLGDQAWLLAKQAKRLRETLSEFQKKDWPEKIDSPYAKEPATHHDAIRGLNTCSFLKFSSAHSATQIAWKKAVS